MKTFFIFSIDFLRKLIEYGRIFSGKTQKPAPSLPYLVIAAKAAFFLLLPTVSLTQPTLVKDINKIPDSAISPGSITSFKGIMYFAAQSSEHGRELWRSDGTDAGTYILKDITPGKNSSSPSMFTMVGSTLYFVANEVHKEDYANNAFEHHYELWKTDGTTQGTVQVGLFPMQSPQTNIYTAYPALRLVATNNALYFTVNNAPTGYELWKTQGTVTGKVLDVSGDPYDPFPNAYQLGAAGNYVYFTATGNTAHFVLWRTDGTTAGTVTLKESHTMYGISSMASVGNILYFAFQHESGNELWKTSGTPQGTQLVKEVNPGLGGLFNANGLLYFTTGTYPNTRLWKSNGTPTGTVLIQDGFKDITIQTAIGNTIYFVSSFQLWKSNGTAAGTIMLKSFEQDSYVSIQTKAISNTLYVGVYVQNTFVFSLWKSNGTPQGTTLIQQFSPHAHTTYFPFLATLQESVYFVFGDSLWKLSGNPASAVPVNPARLSANKGSHPSSLLQVNGLVYFIVSDGASGFELWKTNGSEANTILVKRNGGSGPVQKANLLTSGNNTVYFQVASYNTANQLVSTQLWKSDGTTASTVLIKTLNTGSIVEARYWNGFLYFFTGKQLWKSNGTSQGTVLVKNINTDFMGLLTVWNNALYFKDQTSIWKSDGTPAGTQIVKNVGGYGIGNFTPGNGQLYFTHSSGVWKTNGTPAGTLLISSHSASISSMVFFNGALYFGTEAHLYKSDGTTAGTKIIKTLVKYGENYVENVTVAGNSLYFTFLSFNSDLATSKELWKSNGTSAGTQLVKPVNAQNLKAVHNTLLFEVPRVLNGKAANQLWRSNGTSANTNQVAELSVQLPYSAIAGNALYFSGDDGRRGYELWKYDVEACKQVPATNLLVESSTVCAGDNGKITIKGSQTGVSYQAYYNNGSPAGEAKMGGGDITLSIPAVSLFKGSNSFTVKAGGCTLTTLSSTATITVKAACPTACSATGFISQELWLNVPGSLVSDIPLNTAPTSTAQLTSFESKTNQGTNYGERIRGYLCVPTTGNYTFYLAGDDKCELWLSTDETPTKKVKIASVPYFTGVREWNKYLSQKSASIALVAGKKYYIEALHKEDKYSDNLAVGWSLPNQTSIAVIAGAYLSPFLSSPLPSIARLGLEETLATQMNVYPNPFDDKLTLGSSQQGTLYITITDNLGRTVHQAACQAGSEVNLAHLKAGLYLVKVTTENGSTQVFKVIKK